MAGLSPVDIATRVYRQFGDEEAAQVTDDDIVRYINDAQREISVQHDLMQTKKAAATVANQSAYNLPADILRLRRVAYQGVALQPISQEQADESIPAHDQSVSQGFPTGTPLYYWVYAGQINLYPAPNTDGSTDLTIYYTATIPDLVGLDLVLNRPVADPANVITLPPEYHNSIVDYCMKQAFELDANTQLLALKGQEFQGGLDRIKGAQDWNNQNVYPSMTYTPEYGECY